MTHARSLFALVAASTLAFAPSTLAQQVPAQIEVPADHAAMGKVYRVQPSTKDAQMTFTSDAALEHIKGVSNRVTGYVIAPTSDAIEAGLLAGKFTMAIETIDTGIPMRNEHLKGERWMNAAEHPEITFEIVGVEGATLAKEDSWFKTYDATLKGTMTVRGVTREMKIPARFTFMPESDKTRARAPQGDLLAIRAQYPIVLSDFEIAVGDKAIESGIVADEMTIDTFLLLTTFDPGQRGGRGGQGRGNE
jgi:polyisoprenoid-binding protein YceI